LPISSTETTDGEWVAGAVAATFASVASAPNNASASSSFPEGSAGEFSLAMKS
jgi:hypothetical protein